MADAAEMLWVVLANVSGGDWTKQSAEWQEAASRWRDNYFAAIKQSAGSAQAPETPPPSGLEKVRAHLIRLAKAVTKPTKYGFQMLRRDREDDSIEYQIFADTEPNGTQIAWVQSTRHDADFITACLAQAPLFAELLAASSSDEQAEGQR